MAKVKNGVVGTVLLGTVVKKHDSGICDTDLGKSVNGKYEIGTTLMMDNKTRKVSIKGKTKNSPNKNIENGDELVFTESGALGADISSNLNEVNPTSPIQKIEG